MDDQEKNSSPFDPSAREVPATMSHRLYRQLTSSHPPAQPSPPPVSTILPVEGVPVPEADASSQEEPDGVFPASLRGRLEKVYAWIKALTWGPPFWTIASLFSLAVNIILIVVVVSLAGQLIGLKSILKDQLIGGLSKNFALMDQARIKASVPVNTTVPAKFDLPLQAETTVILQRDTPIRRARVTMITGGMSIASAPTDIVLPAGTELPIKLDLTVPVDQKIPVTLNVDVDIPLNQTDLHTPFTGMQEVVQPYEKLLDQLPSTLGELLCGKNPDTLCRKIIP